MAEEVVERPVDLETFRSMERHFAVPTVEAVIYDFSGYYLLVRRVATPSSGRWTIPGGLIHNGERFHDAVRRVAKREVGLDVTPFKVLHPQAHITAQRHSVGVPILCKGYKDDPVQMPDDGENDLHMWFFRGQNPTIWSPEEGHVPVDLETYYVTILREAELL